MNIQRKTLSDEVALLIAEDIRNGCYENKLPAEAGLMSKYGVGRSTIREAIKMLSHAGLVKAKQGLGTFIEKRSKDHQQSGMRIAEAGFKDVEEIRCIIEPQITAKAAINRTSSDLVKINKCLQECLKAIKAEKTAFYIDANFALHVAIARASKNNALTSFYQSLLSYLAPFYGRMENNQLNFYQLHEDHEQLIESIERSDTKEAKRIMRKIIRSRNKVLSQEKLLISRHV